MEVTSISSPLQTYAQAMSLRTDHNQFPIFSPPPLHDDHCQQKQHHRALTNFLCLQFSPSYFKISEFYNSLLYCLFYSLIYPLFLTLVPLDQPTIRKHCTFYFNGQLSLSKYTSILPATALMPSILQSRSWNALHCGKRHLFSLKCHTFSNDQKGQNSTFYQRELETECPAD